MIVKVEWIEHNRVYSMGIVRFLKLLGYDVDDKKIKQVVKQLLEQQEMADGESKPK